MRGTPPAEVGIDEGLVRRLLAEQAPHLAGLPVHDPRNGWDNRIWRLGGHLAVRLPRREAAAHLLEHEQRWLGAIAARLPLPVPTPQVLGAPGAGYPWAWSVVPWYDGEVAARSAPLPSQAAALGALLGALHVPSGAEAPTNPFRGVPLADRLPWVEDWLATTHSEPDADLVARGAALVIATAREQPASTERRWLHGDLHPRNILVRDGRLAAVLDWGDLCGGDPATDLASVWWLVDPEHHAPFWTAYAGAPAGLPEPEGTWHRSRAWAAIFGLMFLHFATADDPRSADAEAAVLGRAMLRRVLAPQSPPW